MWTETLYVAGLECVHFYGTSIVYWQKSTG